MRILLTILVMTFSSDALARSGKSSGMAFELALGFPRASIGNPDGTKAYYDGLSLTGRGRLPLIEETQFGLDLFGAVRYMDLENTANNSSQKEVAQHIGPGVGFELRLARFFLGADYNFIIARHYGIGDIGGTLRYEMPCFNYYGGVGFTFGRLSIMATYSQASGEVPTSATYFDRSSPYQDTTYWIHFKYSTGVSLEKFGKALMN